jgi:hypothetical protein
MDVHLIDGTYELFRHFFVVPSTADSNGQEIGAVPGVLTSVLSMIEQGATHVGVATDHVVESFRNDLYPGYKTSEGVPPELLSQFPVLVVPLVARKRAGVEAGAHACRTRRSESPHVARLPYGSRSPRDESMKRPCTFASG